MINNVKKYKTWIILGIVFIGCILLNYYVQWRCLDSDMAGEMVLAKLLNDEHSLISNNWYYSTEIRVFCEQVWFKLGLLLFPNNWRIARLIGHSINLGLLELSFIYFIYGTKMREKGLWIAIVLLFPFDLWYLLHTLYGGFYICHTIPVFIFLGIINRYINCLGNDKLLIILSIVFGIMFGLNGIKIIMYVTGPILLSWLLIVLYRYVFSIEVSDKYRRIDKISLISIFSTFIGVIIYFVLISKNYVDSSSNQYIKWEQFNINNILNVISYYLDSFGFINNDVFLTKIHIMSWQGIIGIFGIMNAIIVCASILLLLNKKTFMKCKDKYTFLFICSALFINTIILSFNDTFSNGSYWLPIVPLGFVAIELCIETFQSANKTSILRYVMVISLLLCSIANNSWYLENKPRSYDNLRETSEWLLEDGCKTVITEFWAKNPLVEYSNGKLEVYGVLDFYDLSKDCQLEKISHESIPLHEEVYIVIPSNKFTDYSHASFFDENALKVYVQPYNNFVIYKMNDLSKY